MVTVLCAFLFPSGDLVVLILSRPLALSRPKLYFVKVDVQACFDTIEQTKLLEILRELISEVMPFLLSARRRMVNACLRMPTWSNGMERWECRREKSSVHMSRKQCPRVCLTFIILGQELKTRLQMNILIFFSTLLTLRMSCGILFLSIRLVFDCLDCTHSLSAVIQGCISLFKETRDPPTSWGTYYWEHCQGTCSIQLREAGSSSLPPVI